MSYISSGGTSLGASLSGATQESVLYINRSLQLASGYPNLIFDDGSSTAPMALGVGPVATSDHSVVGAQSVLGLIHAEDPGSAVSAVGNTGLYIQSRYRSPVIQIQNAVKYVAGISGNRLTVGINATPGNIGPGNVDDIIFDGQYVAPTNAPYFRFGSMTYHSGPTVSGPILSVGASAGAHNVGVNQDNPLATLHAGCGTTIPVTSGTIGYYSNFGDVTVALNDNTNKVEVSLGTVGSVPFIGTATPHDLRLRLNNSARAIFTQTGNAFFGNTTPGSYNPEANVLGLTGFPSAAISMAGNRSADGSVGQVAWYNDAAGAGTRVAAILVQRSGANNKSTMTLSTMNAGTITPSVFIGTTQWVGVLNTNPQAALDVTGSVRFSGTLQAGGNTGNSGQVLQSQGAGSTPLWVNSAVTPGGVNTSIQFNESGSLEGTTNFTWNDDASILGLTGTLLIGSAPTATLIASTGFTTSATIVGTTNMTLGTAAAPGQFIFNANGQVAIGDSTGDSGSFPATTSTVDIRPTVSSSLASVNVGHVRTISPAGSDAQLILRNGAFVTSLYQSGGLGGLDVGSTVNSSNGGMHSRFNGVVGGLHISYGQNLTVSGFGLAATGIVQMIQQDSLVGSYRGAGVGLALGAFSLSRLHVEISPTCPGITTGLGVFGTQAYAGYAASTIGATLTGVNTTGLLVNPTIAPTSATVTNSILVSPVDTGSAVHTHYGLNVNVAGITNNSSATAYAAVFRGGSVGVGNTTPNSPLQVTGSISTATTTKTANYTITANDSVVIANAATAAFTVSLPSATNIDGRRYSVKKTDATANIVMVAPPVGVTLDGSTQQTLSSQNQSVDLVAVSGNYFLV